MKYLPLGSSGISSSRLIYGCMRITGDNSQMDREKGKTAIRVALDEGYNHFDHADIYAGGQSEVLFSEILTENPELRNKIVITSKCGIRVKGDTGELAPKRYDFTKDYIIQSVEGSLSRLKTDYLDALLLHRPDYLMDPHEVADAFQSLKGSGKVKHFGISNFTPSQVRLLQSCLDMPLIANQVEINIHNISTFTDGTLDQCQEFNISPQAWSPIAGVVYPAGGNSFTPEDESRIKAELQYQCEKYAAADWIVILAWLLKHPSGIFPIVGTTNPERIRMAKKALHLDYEREDWYRLLEARNGHRVP